jgi:hypothetical protein
MLQYARASSSLYDRVTAGVFEEKDDPHAGLPGERDLPVMLPVLAFFIDDCKQIRRDPEQFLNGPGATITLNEFLRISFWMMIAPRSSLRKHRRRPCWICSMRSIRSSQ